jgi:integrase
MSVRKRYGKWWVDFRFNRRRYRKPSPDNTRAGAQAYETHLRYKLARGEPLDVEEKNTNFKEFVGNWFETYVKNNNKHSEVISKESILRVHLIPYFGRLPLEKIGSLDIEKYKAEKLKEGLCAKTINNHISVIRTSFQSAVEWGIISTCPITKMLKTPPQKYDLLSIDECWLLVQTAEDIWRDMIITALGTGLRFGELIALSWQDVDFEKRELTVRQAFARGVLGSPKSNKTRLIPMSAAVCKVLHNVTRRAPFVFVDSNGKPLKQIASLKKLRRICRRAGLREIGWHCLRHYSESRTIPSELGAKYAQPVITA